MSGAEQVPLFAYINFAYINMVILYNGLDEALRLRFSAALTADYVRVDAFAESSQYDELLAMKQVPKGCVILVAMDGNGFHGQYTRTWHCALGNIYLCMKLEHQGTFAPQALCASQFVVPLALAQIAEKYTDAEVRIKWINDLMLNGAKAAGTLTHYKNIEEKHYFYWGIGLNIVSSPNCNQATTCIAEHLKSEFKPYISSSDTLPPLYFMILQDSVEAIKRQFENYIKDWRQIERDYKSYLVELL